MNLEETGIIELKKIAKEAGIKNISRYKKAELIVLIRQTGTFNEDSENTSQENALSENEMVAEQEQQAER